MRVEPDDLETLSRLPLNGSAPNGHEPTPNVAVDLTVPEEGLLGVAKDFATLYSQYLESPKGFFYFDFLTYFGSLVAKKITLQSELDTEPRLYVVNIGASADTRKSTALRKTAQFFDRLGDEYKPATLFGVGSAEGIAAELADNPNLMLHFDELKSFVDKAKAEHSVALPMVTSLFERNDYDNRIKSERLSVRNASISLIAACTAETYATLFDQKFIAIGFTNRIWLVHDRTTQRIAVPKMIPEHELSSIRHCVRALLFDIDQRYQQNGKRPVAYPLTPEALALFTEWYETQEQSIFSRRLDTYAHRFMLLLAATTGETVITEHIVATVIALLRYQLDVRRECDPVDAQNSIAAMEEKIRRALSRGAMKSRDLKRKTHYDRVGLWVWNTATENLRKARELIFDSKQDLYWLRDGTIVTTAVTSAKLASLSSEYMEL